LKIVGIGKVFIRFHLSRLDRACWAWLLGRLCLLGDLYVPSDSD